MFSSTMKQALLSVVVSVLALHSQAAPLEERAGVCGGLLNTREGGSELCTNAANAFTFKDNKPTLIVGKDSKTTCDHLVELSLMNSELENTLCKPLVADTTKTDDQKKDILKPISAILNDGDNNMFQLTTAAEKFKGQAFTGGGTIAINKNGLPKAQAVQDYLTRTKAKSVKTASDVDAAISAAAKANNYQITAPAVSQKWNSFLTTYDATVAAAVKKFPPPAPKPPKAPKAPAAPAPNAPAAPAPKAPAAPAPKAPAAPAPKAPAAPPAPAVPPKVTTPKLPTVKPPTSPTKPKKKGSL